MKRKILSTVRIVQDLNVEELNRFKLGAEIQDFTEPNLGEGEIKDIVNKYKIEFENFEGIKALHGPFLDLKPASPDKIIRDISFKRYLDALSIAEELKINYIIFHSQINPYLNHPDIEKLNNHQNMEMWLKLLEKTDYSGMILIENIFEESPAMLKRLVETINMPRIKINLDIGHARLGKVSLEEWISELKDYIAYMHIHSNDRLYDGHRAPSHEEIEDLYDLLDKYNINPILSLEYKIENIEEEIKKYRGEV